MSDKPSMQVIDKLIRNRIFNSRYWKQECFALNAQTLIDKAIKIKTVGGLYGGSKKPTKFICLVFKMLQMNLPKQIALQYLKARQEKYLTAITLVYLRLTRKGSQIYELLQPFYNDNRKLIIKDSIGKHSIIYIDQLAQKLLTEQIFMGIALPFIQKRIVLEQLQQIQPRISILQQQGLEVEEELEVEKILEDEEDDKSKNMECEQVQKHEE